MLLPGLLIVHALIALGRAVKIEEDGMITMEIIDHFPCVHGDKDQWRELIRFPDNDVEPVQEDPARQGCYRIGGDVLLKGLVRNGLHMHLELSHGPALDELSAVSECEGYDPDTQCDGFGGDWLAAVAAGLYCNVCDRANMISLQTNTQGATIWLSYKDQRLNCEDAVRAAYQDRNKNTGRAEGLYLHFCLPTKEQFMAAQGITKNIWNKLTGDDKTGEAPIQGETALFMVVRLMEHDFRKQLAQQRAVIKKYREANPDGEIPLKIRQRLAFNRIIWNGRGFVACHKIMGNVKLF